MKEPWVIIFANHGGFVDFEKKVYLYKLRFAHDCKRSSEKFKNRSRYLFIIV